jgi:hypothetical protein
MDPTHVHTVLTPGDYQQARTHLRAQLIRMFLLDAVPMLVLSILMAIAIALTAPSSNPSRLKLIVVLPLVLLGLGLGRAIIRSTYVAIHARRRFAKLESRTLAGESITCAEIDEPFPIRPPKWLG